MLRLRLPVENLVNPAANSLAQQRPSLKPSLNQVLAEAEAEAAAFAEARCGKLGQPCRKDKRDLIVAETVAKRDAEAIAEALDTVVANL